MKVKVINKSKHERPQYGTEHLAGMDLKANLEHPVILKSLESRLIPNGLYIELPADTEAQIRPRSGLSIKKGISVLNAPGTIYADYRGEIMIILVNMSTEEVRIENGVRIC